MERGPAFDKPAAADRKASAADWPMYRHDAAWLGTTAVAVPGELRQLWKSKLGGRLTQPVAADGLLTRCGADAHAVYALDVQTGKPAWNFTAGGRIDSSPTMYEGLVLFG